MEKDLETLLSKEIEYENKLHHDKIEKIKEKYKKFENYQTGQIIKYRPFTSWGLEGWGAPCTPRKQPPTRTGKIVGMSDYYKPHFFVEIETSTSELDKIGGRNEVWLSDIIVD